MLSHMRLRQWYKKPDQGIKLACPYGGNAVLIPLRAPLFGTFWKYKDFKLNMKKTLVSAPIVAREKCGLRSAQPHIGCGSSIREAGVDRTTAALHLQCAT